MGLCLSLRPSQVGVLLKRLNESSWFWHVSFLPPVLHCVKRKFGYLQNKGSSLWNFVLNSGLRKFRHGISIVETCYRYRLSSRKVDAQSMIKWTVVGQLMGLLQLRYEHDSSTIQHPTRSYVLSSNNEHVNSFPLL